MHDLLWALIRAGLVIAAGLFLLWLFLAQPTWQRAPRSSQQVDPGRLRAHVEFLSSACHPRSWRHVQNLAAAADYIESTFESIGLPVIRQAVVVGGVSYKNIIAKHRPDSGPRLVVGAHYDSWEDTPGADDNASGVAVLLEVARLTAQNRATTHVEFVAYTLEEPPFFRTDQMGSVVHAAALETDRIPTRGAIVLEMVGYFLDEPGSQLFPLPLLRLFYPSRGNFIAVVGHWTHGTWVKAVKSRMRGATDLPVYSIRAPSWIPGIDMSDHRSYWPHGIPAVMITDTAFYRNFAYHTRQDTAERLDYSKMADVARAVFSVIQNL
ncbi:MAG: M28 family peptidase [Verrucomicrobiota bacterium]|nr:M28 family peptidase [Verrucomicrobiota bacterium]